MKKTFSFLLLFASVICARPNQRITAVITITNAPTSNGMTVTINGTTRYWTNVATLSYITTNNTIGGCASNLFSSYAQYHDPGSTALQLERNGTNAITLRGAINGALAVTVSDGWATVNLTTNSAIAQIPVAFPISSEPSGATKTNLLNYLVDGINQSTNQVSSNAASMQMFVSINGVQTIRGIQSFVGTVLLQGPTTISGGLSVTGTANSIGTVSIATLKGPIVITNNSSVKIYGPTIFNPTLSNAVNVGTAFSSAGTNSGSEQFGSGATAPGGNALAVGLTALADGNSAVAVGSASAASGIESIAIGKEAGVSELGGIAIGSGAGVGAPGGMAIGFGAQAIHTNSTAIGYNAVTTETNQVMLGTPTIDAVVNHNLTVGGAILGPTISGAMTMTGSVAFTKTNNSGLANGNNAAVVVSGKHYVEVSGPTGAFAICGLAGGTDGFEVLLQNATGQTMTIANNSGGDPTPANRILTGTGADVTVTKNPGSVRLIYNASLNRWVVL